jgi:hypothetical protein
VDFGGVEITGYMHPMLLAFLKKKMYFTAATLSVNYNQTQTYKKNFVLNENQRQ